MEILFFPGTSQVSVTLSFSGICCYSLVKYKLVFILRHFKNISHFTFIHMFLAVLVNYIFLSYQVIPYPI